MTKGSKRRRGDFWDVIADFFVRALEMLPDHPFFRLLVVLEFAVLTAFSFVVIRGCGEEKLGFALFIGASTLFGVLALAFDRRLRYTEAIEERLKEVIRELRLDGPKHLEGKLGRHWRKAEIDTVAFDAFISYSAADTQQVRLLFERLESENVRVWFDEEQIEAGDSISGKIEDGLKRSRYLVVCLSNKQRQSGWSRIEYTAILNQEIQERAKRVIPVIIGELDPNDIPATLVDKKYVDVRTEAGILQLITSLKPKRVSP